jgi:hypothetical protein
VLYAAQQQNVVDLGNTIHYRLWFSALPPLTFWRFLVAPPPGPQHGMQSIQRAPHSFGNALGSCKRGCVVAVEGTADETRV